MKAVVPANEAARLEKLASYEILDTPPDPAFDEITTLAAAICGMPVAMISFMDESRQWFKSKVGLDVAGGARESSFCTHAICGTGLMVVNDARKDERFAGSPWVVGGEGLCFYAGMPLVAPGGEVLGTICVLDRVPRELTEQQQIALQVLSRQVIGRLELHRQVSERMAAERKVLRLNRLHALQYQLSTAILRISGREELFETACRLAVETEGIRAAKICLSDEDLGLSRVAARAGDSSGCPDEIRLVPPLPLDLALKADLQLSTEKHLICTDVRNSPVFQPWKDALMADGLRSAAIFPLGLRDKTLGFLILFSGITDFFDGDETHLLDAVAADISTALELIDQEEKRRHAEMALRDSEERFRTAFEQAAVGICVFSADQRFLRMNARYCQIVGHAPEELRSRLNRDAITHPDDRPADEQAAAKLGAGHSSAALEKRYIREDGRVSWVRLTLSMLRSPAGEPGRFIEFVTDLTARKRVEEELNSLFRLSSDLLCVGNFDGFLEQVNPAWAHCLGWSPEELTGRPFIDFSHPDDREALIAIGARLRKGESIRDFEVRCICKDGSERWVSWSSHPLMESRQIFGAGRDVTERKLNELALERSNRALQLLSRCNEALIRSTTEEELIGSVCRIAVEIGGFKAAWIGYAMSDRERSIVPQGVAGLLESPLPKIRLSWSGESGDTPASRAIRSGRPVLVADLDEAHAEGEWREFEVAGNKFKGAVCLPIKDRTHCFGVLVLYLAGGREVLEDELDLLQELADDAAFGIINLRTGMERRKIHEAVLSLARGISATSGGEFFEKLVSSATGALGACAGFIAKPHADGRRATTICGIVDGRSIPSFDYVLEETPCIHLTKNQIWVVPDSARKRFPHAHPLTKYGIEAYVGAQMLDSSGKSIGLMFLLFRQPLVENEFIASTLKIFAARAAGEMERQKADCLLREQAALLDKAQDAILVCDFEHRISYWNRSAERLYGWNAVEAVGSLARHMLYDDTASLVAATESTLGKGEWLGELEQRTKDGNTVTVESRWTLVRDEHGNATSILSINTDITERKKLEQQFLRVQRMESIGTLAGGIAHDINNVLSPIMMSIDLLRNYVTDTDGENILNMVATSARRGAEMVRQVLTFARGVEGRAEEIQVAPIIEDLSRIIEETFPKNIRVETRLQPDLWTVKGDPTQIHQVLLNLCVNARDAMAPGGRITIKVQNMLIDDQDAATNIEAHPGPYLTIEIEDTGHGIPAEIIDKIFDPFFTTKEQGKGTGLGLSTTLAIMKSHGGFVRAFSRAGAGARFRLYLPAMTELGWASVDASEADLPRGNGDTVLLVDDEVFVRQITRQTLEKYGYNVLLAANGSEAISQFVKHQNDIDVVLTDMMMPVMDGPSTVRALRRLKPQIRIIGASGINAKETAGKAVAAGVDHFLPKPFTAETLLKAVRKILLEPRYRITAGPRDCV